MEFAKSLRGTSVAIAMLASLIRNVRASNEMVDCDAEVCSLGWSWCLIPKPIQLDKQQYGAEKRLDVETGFVPIDSNIILYRILGVREFLATAQ